MEAVAVVAQLMLGIVLMFDTGPEPAPPPPRHPQAVNICHPIRATPEGQAHVDRSVDLCRREERDQ